MIEFVILSLYFIILAMILNKGELQKAYFKFGFIILFCLSAFRSISIGADTSVYCDLYSSISRINDNIVYIYGRFETGFIVFLSILSKISSSCQFFLFITSILIFVSYYRYLYFESKCLWLAFLIFFLGGLFRFSLSALRQCLAISIILIGYRNLYYKKKVFYILAVIAFFFHRSSIIFSISLIISNKIWKKYIYYIVIIFSIVFVTFFGDSLFKLINISFDYSRYIGSKYDDGINTASVFLIFISIIELITIYSEKKILKYNFYLNITYIKTIILIISLKLNAIDRIADYFSIIVIVGLTNSIFNKKGGKKILFEIMVICMYFAYSLIWGIFRPQYQFVWPYKFFWMAAQ